MSVSDMAFFSMLTHVICLLVEVVRSAGVQPHRLLMLSLDPKP